MPIRSLDDFQRHIAGATNYERQLHFRADRETFDLVRLAELAAELGDPHHALPAVHVAGSKGKGSVVLILEALVEAHGRRSGAFLSPHLTSLLERIRTGGRTTSEAAFCRAADRLIETCERTGRLPTFFELTFLISALCNQDAGVELALYEVGLGGRLDATNLLAPVVTAISAIDLEHTEQLGDDLASIAREKAGILKRGVPAVLAPEAEEATAAILEAAAACGAPARLLGRDFAVRRLPPDGPGERLRYEGGPLSGDYRCAALGAHQTRNAALALAACEALAEAGLLRPDPLRAARALAGVALPGRCEPFGDRLLVDAAHTRRSGQALAELVAERHPERPLHLVCAFLAGKPVEQILGDLLPAARSIRVTRVDSPRARDPHEVAATLGPPAVAVDDPHAALEQALAEAGPDGLVVVTGSFYLAGALRPSVREPLLQESP